MSTSASASNLQKNAKLQKVKNIKNYPQYAAGNLCLNWMMNLLVMLVGFDRVQ
jgi:hypothetical protein